MATTQALMTAEQFQQWLVGRDTRAELVRGEVHEMTPVGGMHGGAVMRLGALLELFVWRHRLGRMVTEVGFILGHDPDVVRAPDLAFIRRDHISSEGLPRTFIEGAPDIAIEVVSPNDSAQELADKTYDYQRAGTQEVWHVYSDLRRMAVHRKGSEPRWYTVDDTLDGGELLPGFSLKVGELFEEV